MSDNQKPNGDYKGFRFGVVEFEINEPAPLLEVVSTKLLSINSDLSALDLIDLGAVYADESRAMNAGSIQATGQKVRLHTSPRRYQEPQDLLERIIRESSDYVIYDKPSGLPLTAEVDNFKENIIGFLSERRRETYYPVNLLDPESAGLIVLAKSPGAAENLKSDFAKGRVARIFAVFVAKPEELKAHRQENFEIEILASEERNTETDLLSEGSLSWRVQTLPRHSRLTLRSRGARPKEIREFFAAIGNPILGDTANGSASSAISEQTGKSSQAICVIDYETN